MKKSVILGTLILTWILSHHNLVAQEAGKTLFSINNHNISSSEFEWAYKKNNSGTTKSSVDDYLTLYINYKLKVTAAEDAGMDKTASFRKELEGYRHQLARTYLTDSDARDELLKKSYLRYLEEINVYHVLVACRPDAAPPDTLVAWEKAMKIRERIRLGEPFESVARGASDDPYVLINGGNLGYLTVFQTPPSFENAIYSMAPGSLSQPVRTPSGYHIIKVQDRRKSVGSIRVSHIMIRVSPDASEERNKQAYNVIDSLYQLLQDGADFQKLARDNSDDLSSASNGGELPWFTTGEMDNRFSEAAFSLTHDGDISKPIRSAYGWHIIERLEKKGPLSFENAKSYLEGRINQSYLLDLSRSSFIEKLKKEYKLEINKELKDWFVSRVDTSLSGIYRIQNKIVPSGIIYSFDDTECAAADFMKYIMERGPVTGASDPEKYISGLLNMKVSDDLIRYEDSNLEKKYPEFRYLVNEYHDGILLFEISDSIIWSKAVSDTAGLISYYNKRREEFTTEPIGTGTVYQIAKIPVDRKIRKLVKMIKKYDAGKIGIDRLYSESIVASDTLVHIQKGSWLKGSNPDLDKAKWVHGIQQYKQDGEIYLVNLSDTGKPGYLPFNKVRDRITDDYIRFLDSEWVKQLRTKYSVNVDMTVLKELRKKLEPDEN